MTIENLKNTLPDYAKDIKLNLSSVLTENGAPGLDLKQIAFIAVAREIEGGGPLTHIKR